MRTLTVNEVEDVGGAFGVPGAVIGGVTGGIVYAWNAAFTKDGSLTGLAGAVAGGAFMGAVGGPMSAVRAVWSVNAATVVGVANGVAGS